MTITSDSFNRAAKPNQFGVGMNGGSKSKTPVTPGLADFSTFLTLPTTFPHYTSGAWADLPMGTWNPPAPTTPPTPSTPIPPPPSLHQNIQGLLGGLGGGKKGTFSSLSPDALATLTQGWGLFGGGAPMPTMRDPYQKAYNHYDWP